RSAGPHRHDSSAELAREIDGPSQEVRAASPVGRALLEEGRTVLATRIEEEARARFDREREPEFVGELADGFDLARARMERVEAGDVGRDRDAFVPEIAEQRQRVEDAVVREAVRVVGEAEHGWECS